VVPPAAVHYLDGTDFFLNLNFPATNGTFGIRAKRPGTDQPVYFSDANGDHSGIAGEPA